MNKKILYQTIFDSMDDGVIVVDTGFNVMAVNKAWKKITGYSQSDALRSKCFEVCAGKFCKTSCDIEKAFDSGVPPADFEITVTDKTGQRKIVNMHTTLLKDENDQLSGCIRIIRDLTELRKLQHEKGERKDFFKIVGKSPPMQRVYELIENIKDIPLPVLITGETGSGKELICDAIHLSSLRASGSLIKVNLSALPESLIESELFGYEKGAFTGATTSKVGRFDLADGGTLFLDEISNINEAVQRKLLRVVETKRFERIGGRKEKQVDVRLIFSTNIDLKAAIARGEFRKDLFYRISAAPIYLVPLRERKEDIPLLADHFLSQLNENYNKKKSVSPEALKFLIEYHWPGNVREFKNVLEFVYSITGGDELPKECFLEFLDITKPEHQKDEKTEIATLLFLNKWNIQKTASALGIDRTTLWRKMKKLDLSQ